MHLSAFEQLNRCLDVVKEWMSASKLKLNPDKFIIFGSKKQKDKLKACFPISKFQLWPVDFESSSNFLVIPKFHPSVYKSVKQFGNTFAFDAVTIWNALPDEHHASTSLPSFRKQLEIYLYKAYPP